VDLDLTLKRFALANPMFAFQIDSGKESGLEKTGNIPSGNPVLSKGHPGESKYRE
jgi:hypothetical protein